MGQPCSYEIYLHKGSCAEGWNRAWDARTMAVEREAPPSSRYTDGEGQFSPLDGYRHREGPKTQKSKLSKRKGPEKGPVDRKRDEQMMRRQSAARRKEWANPQVRARRIAGIKRAWADPEVRAKGSAASKRAWAAPEVRAKLIAARKKMGADPEVQARKSASLKKRAADPAVRAKMSEASKRAWADPAVRAKVSAAMKRALANPDVRAKLSAAGKRAWANPELRPERVAANKKGWAGTSRRARQSAMMKRVWSDPEMRKRNKIGRLKAAAVLLGIAVPEEADLLTIETLRSKVARSRGGRPSESERFAQAEILRRERGWSYSKIAKKLTPLSWRNNPRAAAEAIRKGIGRKRASGEGR